MPTPSRVFPKQAGADRRFGSFLTFPGKTLAPLRLYSKEDVNHVAQGHTSWLHGKPPVL